MKTCLAIKESKFAGNNFAGEKTSEFLTEKPLSNLKSGDFGTVRRLEGGEEFRNKMISLGIIPGKTITVAKGEKNQPFLLRIDESRVMMDSKTLDHIYVQPGRF